MSEQRLDESIEVGTNFFTIRGDSELGRFLNEALQKSMHQDDPVETGSVSSITNLQISLQNSQDTGQARFAHHRSCSKIKYNGTSIHIS